MVKIVIENLGQKEVPVADPNKPVLYQFQASYIDYMHDCGGKGRCTTCKMKVVSGMENLTPLSWAEKKYRAEKQLLENERLACQVRLSGDLVIRIPKTSQLPHVRYEG